MWFKNIQLFQFGEDIEFAPEALAEQLQQDVFVPCPPMVPMSMGWVSPLHRLMRGDDAPLVYGANGFMQLCLRIEERLLPNGVITEAVQEKVFEIEEKFQRKVRRKERQQLKEEITEQLLPQAFTQSQYLSAYIDTKQRLLVVDTSSRSKAENFVTFLRKSLGSLKLENPEVLPPTAWMTHCLKVQDHQKMFTVEDFCVFQDGGGSSGGVIRCQRQDLFSDPIQAFLEHGCSVSQMAMVWQEQVHFVLHDDASLRQIKFLDVVLERASESMTETDVERYDADFVIMTETLSQLLQQLLQLLQKEAAVSVEELATA